MSRVITFSTKYPAKHSKAGQPTLFVEKVMAGFNDSIPDWRIPNIDYDWEEYCYCKDPKYHTIRAGRRWKVGDKFSPRIWSRKPYASKQIKISDDIELVKIWDFEISGGGYYVNGRYIGSWNADNELLQQIAKNDGLTVEDMIEWFSIHPKSKEFSFEGQILCWNKDLIY